MSVESHPESSELHSVAVSCVSRKRNQCVTMDTKSTIKFQDDHVHADRQLLFQRPLAIGTGNGELQNGFDREHCHYPSALFESVNAIRPTTKYGLSDALWTSEVENFLDHLKRFYMS